MKKIVIEYCVVWNYYPRAARLAEELKDSFHYAIEMEKSKGGRFEVTFDGNLIFSKAALGRFPEDGEVEKLIKENE